MKLSLLALTALRAVTAFAKIEVEETVDEAGAPSQSPTIAVSISASFPGTEVFGIKLVNGHATQAVLSFTNGEPEAVKVEFIGGSLWALGLDDKKQPYIVRNLTVTKYNVEIPAGQNASLPYNFATELHPQDLRLNLGAVVSNAQGSVFPLQVFNETVSIVEAPVSIFDPQIIFLYLLLASIFAGTCYAIYTTWIKTLFPQKRGRGKGGERAKITSKGSKVVDSTDQVSAVGADGPAVTTGSKGYDESWIPAQHLQRPEAKRVGSGRPSTPKTRAKA